MTPKMKHAKGERLNIRFNSKIKLEFHDSRLTSDGGLLAYRKLDYDMLISGCLRVEIAENWEGFMPNPKRKFLCF